MSQSHPPVKIYTTRFCPFCIRAKHLLNAKQVEFDEIRVDFAPEKRAEMRQRSGRNTVPQIWIGGQHIGGCDELYALEARQQLDVLLAER